MPARRVWVAGAAVVGAAAIGVAIMLPVTASGAVDLPDMTVEELIEFAGAGEVDALSGTIEQTSELGLPDLGALTPSSGERGADDAGRAADIDDLIALATGSHTAKVYVDGERARLQVLDQLGERNVYADHSTNSLWFVDSESKTATEITLPDDGATGTTGADDLVATPDEMLDDALARLDETTAVTVGTDGRVAGRDAYELILEPRTPDTLVGEVRFAIDGENGAALAMSITARGASEPAFELAFTDVDFSAPDEAVFAYEPGAGITVTEKDLSDRPDGEKQSHEAPGSEAAPVVIGEGWSSVIEVSAGADDQSEPLTSEQQTMLDSLTVSVDGGRAMQSSLISVLLTDDGRMLVGAVPVSRLTDVAQPGR